MLENPFATIIEGIQDQGVYPDKVLLKAYPDDRWFIWLRVGKKFKKVQYADHKKRLIIYERKWLRYREVASMPLHNEEQAEQAVQAILSSD